jgi:aminopeptidase N
MALDSFATTHPVVQQVRTVEQANQAFDNITYDKGQSIIGMLEAFAGADVWRQGIRNYMAKFAYRNTRTADLWAAIEGAGAKGLTAVARDFTSQPGIPLVQLGNARCVNGRTVVPATLSQFSNDRREQSGASPLAWHIPLRATAGVGSASLQVTQGHSATLNAPGCGVLLINPGQTGYFRVLYTPQQAEGLRRAFPNLRPVDQYGVLSDAFALSNAGYQGVGRALDLLAAIPADAHAKVAEKGAGEWVALFRQMDGNSAAQAAIRDHASRVYWPRLQQLGFRPRSSDSPLDALLRASLIADLGELGEPHVVAEGQRLLGALQRDSNAIPGSLKAAWLGVIARNADSNSWEALHRMAAAARSSTERTTYYELLGLVKNDALAKRALDLAISKEPGATVSAGMINSTAENHPTMTLDFVLSHLKQVTPFVDLSGSSGYVAGLVEDSADATLIPKIQAYAAAHIKPDDRRPINQAAARIKWKADNQPRLAREIVAWLKAHPVGQGG